MKILILFLISIGAQAQSIAFYKKEMLKLSPEQLWQISQMTKRDKGVWYFTDKTIDKVWYGTGACYIKDQRTCKNCSCDYAFKSKHPNNRYKGDYPYESYSEGYPHHPDKIPVSGCMQINKLKGSCDHLENFGLCNISSDVKVVLKEYIKKALNDPKDPCGLYEFSKTDFYKEVISKIKDIKKGK